jgi:hypothetical protein
MSIHETSRGVVLAQYPAESVVGIDSAPATRSHRQRPTWLRGRRPTRPLGKPIEDRKKGGDRYLNVAIQIPSRPQGGRLVAGIECGRLGPLLQFHDPHTWDASDNSAVSSVQPVHNHRQLDESVACSLTQRGERPIDHRRVVVRPHDHGTTSGSSPRLLCRNPFHRPAISFTSAGEVLGVRVTPVGTAR